MSGQLESWMPPDGEKLNFLPHFFTCLSLPKMANFAKSNFHCWSVAIVPERCKIREFVMVAKLFSTTKSTIDMKKLNLGPKYITANVSIFGIYSGSLLPTLANKNRCWNSFLRSLCKATMSWGRCKLNGKTKQECETALTSQYQTLFLSFCLLVYSFFCFVFFLVFFYFVFFVFLSLSFYVFLSFYLFVFWSIHFLLLFVLFSFCFFLSFLCVEILKWRSVSQWRPRVGIELPGQLKSLGTWVRSSNVVSVLWVLSKWSPSEKQTSFCRPKQIIRICCLSISAWQ